MSLAAHASPALAPLQAAEPDAISFSFEFFPPRTPAQEDALWETIGRLEPLAPRFVSVTYGAGGSTREPTGATVARIVRETSLSAAAHLTCVGASRDEVDAIAHSYWTSGVGHIVALRGDGGVPGAAFAPHPQGYQGAADLVAGLKRIAPFEISVAAYPEGHPDSRNPAADLDNLWRKIDAGADRAISQFFFSAERFLRFRDQAAALGIDTEIVPGVLPIANVAQTRKFARQCGTAIPPHIDRLLDGLDEQPATRELVAAMLAADLCARLHAGGVRHFHFFTLNRPELASAICHMLGARPQETHHDCRRTA
jgi:methylenetetrahydrofolate reductase (NADPH)